MNTDWGVKMRSCQLCATPIPTSAKTCTRCGAEQRTTVGGEDATCFPEVLAVGDENSKLDQQITRGALMTLLGGAVLISGVTGGVSGSFILAFSVFFVALLSLYLLFQVIGIDVSL